MASGRRTDTMGPTGYRPLAITLVLALAWLGLWAHELYRVPSALGLTPDGSLPMLAIAVVLLVWWLVARRKRAASTALLVYGLISAAGGMLSVLPLPFLPFVPEQTVDHYLIHILYAACQLPLCLVALSAGKLPRTRPRPAAHTGASQETPA
jgi:hypothetical protein